MIKNNLVLDELNRILAFPAFRNSPLLTKFLDFVVRETLAGRENLIKEYTIATEVLGRSPEFMNNHDASVRVHAMRLRKLLGDFYEQAPNKGIIIELPKGSYRPVFKWVDGNNHNGYAPRRTEVKELVCIVPFTGLLDGAGLNFSITGFCEYLSEQLSRFEDVSVLSFQSVQDYMEGGGQLSRLHSGFGVDYYLTGSMEMNDKKLLVSVQLYDAIENELIWSNDTSREIGETDFMDIIEDISKCIVSSLAGYSGYVHYRLLQNAKQPRLTGAAANAVFWFYNFQARHSEELFYEAVKQLEASVKADGRHALTWAVLGELYCDGIIYNYNTGDDPLSMAEFCVNKAMALDDQCQHAYLSRAWINIFRGEWELSIVNQEKMLELNPHSSYFISIYSLGMAFANRYEESLRYWEEALKLNPLPYWWLSVPKIFTALKLHRYEEALFHAQKRGTPKMVFEHIFEMIALYRLGRINEVNECLVKYVKKNPGGLQHIAEKFPLVIRDEEVKSIVTETLNELLRMVPAMHNHPV